MIERWQYLETACVDGAMLADYFMNYANPSGSYYQIKGTIMNPPSIQKPIPRLLIVGNYLDGEEILHNYLLAAFSVKLNIPIADLETRLAGGETMAQIALSSGLTIDQFLTLMFDVRAKAIEQALNDGVFTQEETDLMNRQNAGQLTGCHSGNDGYGMRRGMQGQFPYSDHPNNNQVNP